MRKNHCDLCDRVVLDSENLTTFIKKDRNGFTIINRGVVREDRTIRVDICDDCVDLLRKKAEENKK